MVAVVCIFGWPVIKILTNHHARILEMKLRLPEQSGNAVLSELRELKEQMNELRDTTTRYDISFDAALQRMESRMTNVEQRINSVEQLQPQARIGS